MKRGQWWLVSGMGHLILGKSGRAGQGCESEASLVSVSLVGSTSQFFFP